MSSNKNFDYNDRYIYSRSDHSVNNSLVKSKKIRNKKILFSIAIIFSVLSGLFGGIFIYAYHMLDSLNYKPMTMDGNEQGHEYVAGSAQDPMVLNVALFGVDRHAQADIKSRSDTILILSLDSRRKKIKLTSLMRDMWLPIPGYKENRINTAIARGGEQLAIKTIEQNFGIKIDRYCTVDFEGFKDIIDIIGGIDINITKKEAYHINRLLVELDAALVEGGLKPFKSPLVEEVDGVHHLNGAQALQYARSRKVPTAEGMHDDYARTFRQRRVISLVVDKLKSSSLPQLLSVIEKVGPYINTDLRKNEIITLGKNSIKYLQYEIVEFRLPEDDNFEGKNINGASVLVIKDMQKARLDLARFIYEDSVKEVPSNTSKQKVQTPEEKSSSQNSVTNQQTASKSENSSKSSEIVKIDSSNEKQKITSLKPNTKSKNNSKPSHTEDTDKKVVTSLQPTKEPEKNSNTSKTQENKMNKESKNTNSSVSESTPTDENRSRD